MRFISIDKAQPGMVLAMDVLEGYYATDLRLFQTKVHGIKGVSRQFEVFYKN